MALPFAASRRRWASLKQASVAELLAQHAVLLLQVLEDVDLAPIHPAREHEQQKLERRDRHAG